MRSNKGCKPQFVSALESLLQLVAITKKVVAQFFPGISISAPFVSELKVSAVVSPQIFVLLTWIRRYPNTSIEKDNPDDLLKLKQLYIDLRLPWETDPLIEEAMNFGII